MIKQFYIFTILFLLFNASLYAQDSTDAYNLDSLMKKASEAEKMEDC